MDWMVPFFLLFGRRYQLEDPLLGASATLEAVATGVADLFATVRTGVGLGAGGAGTRLAFAAAKDLGCRSTLAAVFAGFARGAVRADLLARTIVAMRGGAVAAGGTAANSANKVLFAVVAEERLALFAPVGPRTPNGAVHATEVLFTRAAKCDGSALPTFGNVTVFAEEDRATAVLTAEELIAPFAVARGKVVLTTSLTDQLAAFTARHSLAVLALHHLIFANAAETRRVAGFTACTAAFAEVHAVAFSFSTSVLVAHVALSRSGHVIVANVADGTMARHAVPAIVFVLKFLAPGATQAATLALVAILAAQQQWPMPSVRGKAERTHSFCDFRNLIGYSRPVMVFRFSLRLFFVVVRIFQFREARPVLRAVVLVQMVMLHQFGNFQRSLLDRCAVQIREAKPRKDVRRQFGQWRRRRLRSRFAVLLLRFAVAVAHGYRRGQ